ncbi:MAG: LEA type 2 family protein [Planctomycetota bacterium]|nr:LEA type 2 family protein [Planctomycetota bacterium]
MVAKWCAVAAMVAGLSGCATMDSLLQGIQKPSAKIVGARLSELRMDSVVLGFDVEVSNPYAVALPLTNVEYSLASGGAAFLTGKAETQGTVPAKATKVFTVPAKVDFAGLLSSVNGITPGAVVPYQAKVTLSADAPGVGVITLPLSKTGELPVPALPSIELSELQWQTLSFDKAQAMLRVKIGNGNQFPAELAKLGMALSLGGHRIGSAEVSKATQFAAGGENTIEIPVAFSPKELGLAAFGLLRGSGSGYRITGAMKLNTAFGAIDMPYEKTGETKFK